ncbi:MAG: glycosyltransferase family 39 protein [Thermodesulfobacteriota bacterium]|nr:glycosyltransferase family 39 protein [Thermodesulfobacteriota bacterium]
MNLQVTTNGNNKKGIAFIIFIILFAGLIRVPSLTQPIGPDQGIMAVIGEGILQGKLPYRDYWEMASPAIFFTYAFMFKVFGASMAAIPITDTLVSMLTTFLIFLLTRHVWGNNAGYISALFFAFFSSGVRLGMHAGGDIAFGTFWYISQRETFMLPLIIASIYFTLYAEKHPKRVWGLILSGFLAGLTFVYKFPALLFFICLLAYLNWSLFSNKNQEVMKSFLIKNFALVSGFILAIIPFVLFFSMKGAVQEMTDIIVGYVYSVYGQLEHNHLETIKLGISHTCFVAKENFILWIFFIASSIYIIIHDRKKENVLIVLWAFAAISYVISHREFFGYHYLMVLPPFAVLTGYGLLKALEPNFKLRRVLTGEIGKTFIIFAVLANLFIFATLNHMHYMKFFFYSTGEITKENYYDFFNAYPKHDYSFPADYQVAQYILKHTDSDDMIYSLGGIESAIYFMTKRRSPSRFIFSWILFSYAHSRVQEAEVYRKELLVDLKTKIPKYIITVGSLEIFKDYSDIYNFIQNNYIMEKTFPDDRFVYAYKADEDRNVQPSY